MPLGANVVQITSSGVFLFGGLAILRFLLFSTKNVSLIRIFARGNPGAVRTALKMYAFFLPRAVLHGVGFVVVNGDVVDQFYGLAVANFYYEGHVVVQFGFHDCLRPGKRGRFYRGGRVPPRQIPPVFFRYLPPPVRWRGFRCRGSYFSSFLIHAWFVADDFERTHFFFSKTPVPVDLTGCGAKHPFVTAFANFANIDEMGGRLVVTHGIAVADYRFHLRFLGCFVSMGVL